MQFAAVVVGAMSIASCGKPEAPPPPKVEPPKVAAPTVNAELKRLVAETYIYAYPMVLSDVTRAVATADLAPNTFQHTRTMPDASTVNIENPNADFLYSQAWLDLSHGPVLLSVPDTKGRYYLIAMLDAWTNVAASLGKRTTGTEKQTFAIVGPNWKGKLPGGVSEVESPTDLAWLFVRTETHGKDDREAAIKVQDQYKLAPLSKPRRGDKAAAAAKPGTGDLGGSPRQQVSKMDAATFFTRFAMLLPDNPPVKEDGPMVEKMKKVGIEAGKPFDPKKLDAISAQSIDEGVKSARDAIEASAKNSLGGDIRNGWIVDRALGRWGTDYGKRAVAAWNGLGANAPEDAIFMSTHVDSEGHRLDGSNRYVVHVDSGKSPPADGFWSLSLYDENHHFVANGANRTNIGSNDNLEHNADGSTDIYIQNAEPADGGKSNWLPAPKGPFNVVLRIYWPKPDVVDGKWTAPGLRRVK